MNKSDLSALFAAENEARATELLLTLARIPAPSGKEGARAEFCRNFLLDSGAPRVDIDREKNVILAIGDDGSCPLSLVMAHSDVVFPDTEPLPIRIEGNRMVGPGVGDDTANVVALLLAASYLIKEGILPKGRGLLIVINSCEEGLGNLRGSKEIFRRYGDRIDEAVSLDGTGDSCVVRAVGSLRYRVSVKTEGGHSYAAFGKPNAIACLAELISELYEYTVPSLGKTTYNVGKVSGGTSVNTIAEEAEMLFELRSDERTSLADVDAAFRDVLERHRREGVTISLETVGERPCMGDVDEEKMKRLFARTRSILHHRYGDRIDEVKPRSGSTDCNVPLSLGIPAVCYGCYLGGGAHTYAEYVELSSIRAGLSVALDTLLAMSGRQ